MIHIDISGVTSTLLLSEYGERMHWACPIPKIEFDPGDGNPIVLRINCLNSVDTSTVLEIVLSWFRLVCGNGINDLMVARDFCAEFGEELKAKRSGIKSANKDEV